MILFRRKSADMAQSIRCPHCQTLKELSEKIPVGTVVKCLVCKREFSAKSSQMKEIRSSPNRPQRRRSRKLLFGCLGSLVLLILGVLAVNRVGPWFVGLLDNQPQAKKPDVAGFDAQKFQEKSSRPASEIEMEGTKIPEDLAAKLNDATTEASRPFLLEMLEYPMSSAQVQAMEQLAELPADNESATAVAKKLKSDDFIVVWAAIRALAKVGADSAEVVPALSEVLGIETEAYQQQLTIESLTELGKARPERAIEVSAVLQKALSKTDSRDIRNFVEAFSALGDATRPAVPLFEKLLGKTGSDIEVMGLLAQYGSFAPLKPVLAEIDGAKSSQRISIASGIGRMRPMTPEALEVLNQLFADKDATVRLAVLQTLKECEPKLPEAIALLEKAQGDPVEEVQSNAIGVLAAYETDPVRRIDKLLNQLAKSQKQKNDKSYEIITAILDTPTNVLEVLLAILNDAASNPEVRQAAVVVMVRNWKDDFYDPAKSDQVKALLKDAKNPLFVRAGAAVVLKKMNVSDPLAIATLKEVIPARDLQHIIHDGALDAIPPNDSTFIPLLFDAVKSCEQPAPPDASPESITSRNAYHKSVLFRLREMYSVDANQLLPRLLTALQVGDISVKETALAGVASLRPESPEAVELIRPLLKDSANEIRKLAALALGNMHKSAVVAIPDLRLALKDTDYWVRGSVVAALGNFGPTAMDAVPDLIALLQDEEKESTLGVPQALMKIAPQSEIARAAVVGALKHKYADREAVDALGELGPQGEFGVSGMRQLLLSAEGRLQFTILQAFSNIGEGASDAIPEILKQTTSTDADLRAQAVETLGRLRGKAGAVVPDLVRLLEDNSEDVQTQVIEALQRIGKPATVAIPNLQKFQSTSNSSALKSKAEMAIAFLKLDPGEHDPAIFYDLLDDSNWSRLAKKFEGQAESKLQELSKLLSHEDERLRSRSWYVMTTLAQEQDAIATLERMLSEGTPPKQALAATMLRRLPLKFEPTALANSLIPFMENEQTSWQAASMFAQLGNGITPILADAITSSKIPPQRRARVLNSSHQYLAGETVTDLLPLLREALSSPQPEQRQAAALALAKFNPQEPGLLPIVVATLESDDLGLLNSSLSAVEALANSEIDITSAKPGVLRQLRPFSKTQLPLERDTLERCYVAFQLLNQIGVGEEDFPALKLLITESLKKSEDSQENVDEYELLRYVANLTKILGGVGPKAQEVLPILQPFLVQNKTDEHDEAINCFAVGFAKMGPGASQMLQEISRNKDIEVPARRLAISVLAQMDLADAGLQSTLRELLRDEDADVRQRTAMVLVEEPGFANEALPVLRQALVAGPISDERRDERGLIVYRLRGLKDLARSAIPELIQVAKRAEIDNWLRGAALGSLMEIAPQSTDVKALFVEALRTFPDEATYSLFDGNFEWLGKESIDELVRAVEHESEPYRTRAIRLLGNLEDRAIDAVPVLRNLAESEPYPTGLIAAISIARIDPTAKDLAPRLMSHIVSNPEDQLNTVAALERLGPNPAEAIPQLLTLMRDKDRGYIAFQLIGALGPASKPLLPELLKSLDLPETQYLAAETLIRLGPAAADLAPELISRMRQTSETTTRYSRIVASMGEPAQKVVSDLIEDLKVEGSRLKAIRHLGAFGKVAGPAVPALMELGRKDDFALRIAVLNALAAIGDHSPELAAFWAAYLLDADPRIAEVAASGLEGMGKNAVSVLPQVIKALESFRPRTRNSLLQLLGKIGPAGADAIPTLRNLLTSADWEFKGQIKGTLKKLETVAVTTE